MIVRRLGWNGVKPGSQSEATLNQCSAPCTVARFFAAVDSAIASTNPMPSPAPTGAPIPPMREAVGGYYHSLAISRSGKLFSWGCGNFGGDNDGQQGLGDTVERTDPAPVDGRAWGADAVIDAAAGCYHSVTLTKTAGPGSDGGLGIGMRRVFTFGLNNYGEVDGCLADT